MTLIQKHNTEQHRTHYVEMTKHGAHRVNNGAELVVLVVDTACVVGPGAVAGGVDPPAHTGATG